MHRIISVLLCTIILVFVLAGCGEVPSETVVVEPNPTPTERPLPFFNMVESMKVNGVLEEPSENFSYVTVSGIYYEEDLIKICKRLGFSPKDKNFVFFFEPNAPRNEEGHEEEGLPNRDYKIAEFVVYKGEVKRLGCFEDHE